MNKKGKNKMLKLKLKGNQKLKLKGNEKMNQLSYAHFIISNKISVSLALRPTVKL